MVYRIVLDVELSQAEPFRQPMAAYERREARVEPGARLPFDRQKLAVAPEILWTPLDVLAGQANRAVVVHRLERTQTPIADVNRLGGECRLTEMTLQSDQRAHTASAYLKV